MEVPHVRQADAATAGNQPSPATDRVRRHIPIYAGSDTGGLPHGRVVDEIIRLAHICMPAEEVLAAGSWAARRWLGLPGIEEDAPADIVVYDDDPRDDLKVLRNPRYIVIGGRVARR